MENSLNQNALALLRALGLDPDGCNQALRALSNSNAVYLRELKINLDTALGSPHFEPKEPLLIACTVAANEHNDVLAGAFGKMAATAGATPEEIGECYACASLMGVNNVFYKFKHFMEEGGRYRHSRLGMRMAQVLQPISGKRVFELMGLAVSVVNGCGECVVAHEQGARLHGATEPQVLDTVRLAAVIKGLAVVVGNAKR